MFERALPLVIELEELNVGYGEFDSLPRVGIRRFEESLFEYVGTPFRPSLFEKNNY